MIQINMTEKYNHQETPSQAVQVVQVVQGVQCVQGIQDIQADQGVQVVLEVVLSGVEWC